MICYKSGTPPIARQKDYDELTRKSEKVSEISFEHWINLGKRTLLDVLTAKNEHFSHQIAAVNQRDDGYIASAKLLASGSVLLNALELNQLQ